MPLSWNPSINNRAAVGVLAAQYAGQQGTMGVAKSQTASLIPLQGYYSSFSGEDIVATITIPGSGFEPVTFANIRTIAYSVQRDKRAVRVLGTINPIGWCRSNRLIAGTLVFASFDRYVWMPMYANSDDVKPGEVILADTLPPFDITISALNEYGQMSRFCIRGCCIVDEGGVVGVDEMYVEQTHTFVALDIVPWIPTP
jgi:hypothetical protein